jgi:uncharacterized membrane protein YbaN (DUF454 family)
MTRGFYFILGLVAVALAVLGALLPLLPTTPFLLVAAWAFARSSPRLEAKLLAHARFGPMIADWRRAGAIDRRAKRVSALVMVATLVGGALAGLSMTLLAVQAAVLAAVSWFIWTRPEPARGSEPAGGRS